MKIKIKKSVASLAIVFTIATNCFFLITYGNWLYCKGVQNRESIQLAMMLWWITLFFWALFAKKMYLRSYFVNAIFFTLTIFISSILGGFGLYGASVMVIYSGSTIFGMIFSVLNAMEFYE